MPQSIFEIIALTTGILCVFLQTKEKIWAWPFGIISVTISAYIFYNSRLYSDVLLHVLYFFLNIYGWYSWSQNRKSNQEAKAITLMSALSWKVWPIVLIMGVFALGTIMKYQFNADLVYFDAFTTVGSVIAQYLLAQKILQNWLLWIIVDLVAIPVYLYKGLYFIAFLFFVYLILCTMGYFDWRRSYRASLVGGNLQL